MRYRFADCELDTDRHELWSAGEPVRIEPQVFDLLALLVQHPGRLVSRDELIARVWGGRIVSESTISARINAARKAVGDDGERQGVIATVPRRGIKLVAAVEALGEPQVTTQPMPVPSLERLPEAAPNPTAPRRASIAVMPFADPALAPDARGGLGDALAHDVITRLAKLRSLFVIAQGTVFALDQQKLGAEAAGRLLDVDYALGGMVERRDDRIVVGTRLVEVRTGRVIWAETLSHKANDTFLVLDEIGNRIVASVASEIETAERNRAILKPPSSLDAWEAYHRGLWHMYRFTRADNEQARGLFEQATRQDPTFSRAFAGLSFTYWQDAFQNWATDRQKVLDVAYDMASDSILADDRDPAAHWAMGRALWLRGRQDESVAELEQAVDLSPNFALAHYNLAFVHATTGDAAAAVTYSDASRELSPYDPMLFGILGARAMALVRLGRYDEAADWAIKAAARPNSFPHIRGIAAFSLALADRMDEARAHLAALVAAVPGYTFADFQRAFRFDANGVNLFRKGARKLGVV
ncbi:MAG: winged helix-turn-helix domain-containing tetratricopeptide repeat protein [Hyphomicrobiaceae bacterium]